MVLILWWKSVLLFHRNVALHATMVSYITIAQTENTIAAPWQLTTGSIHEYLVFSSKFYLRYWEMQIVFHNIWYILVLLLYMAYVWNSTDCKIEFWYCCLILKLYFLYLYLTRHIETFVTLVKPQFHFNTNLSFLFKKDIITF